MNSNTENLLKRGNMALEDRDFDQATEFYERALDTDAECAQAYWGKILSTYKAGNAAELGDRALEVLLSHAPNSKDITAKDIIKIVRDADRSGILKQVSEADMKKFAMKYIDFYEVDSNGGQIQLCQESKGKYTTPESLLKLFNNKDLDKAYRFKDQCVEQNLQITCDSLEKAIESTGEAAQPSKFQEEMKRKVEAELNRLSREIAEQPAKEEALYQKKVAAREESYQRRLKQYEEQVADYEAKKRIADQQRDRLYAQINQLEKEKASLRGFFTENKRRSLELRIAAIRMQIIGIQYPSRVWNKPAKPGPLKRRESKFKERIFENFVTSFFEMDFGSYPYEANGAKKPIKWLMLKKEGNKYLLLSKYGLDVLLYHKIETNITWETCSMRKWLNSTFVDTAFTINEKQRILMSPVQVGTPAYKYLTDYLEMGLDYTAPYAGNNTQDRVFLLSLDEAMQYFEEFPFQSNISRKAYGTPYAFAKKAYNQDGAVIWWLRTMGIVPDSVCGINESGEPDVHLTFEFNEYTVRPALWVTIEN